MPRTDDTVRFKNDTSVLSVCYACIIISEITLQLFFLYISEPTSLLLFTDTSLLLSLLSVSVCAPPHIQRDQIILMKLR